MDRFLALLLLLFVCISSLTCGSTGRHLQSITISKTANGTQIEFGAGGTFSSSPTTVNPLAVAWSMGMFAPPPKHYTYTLSAQLFVVDCTATGSGPVVVSAVAPLNPNAPSSGTLPMSDMLVAGASSTCP
jgi:hypothetical protein